MDSRLCDCHEGDLWSGLVQSMLGEQRYAALAHGELLTLKLDLPADTKAMIYNWQVSSLQPITLSETPTSQVVPIPLDSDITYLAYKEACAGIGGIGFGANLLGMQSLASMDLNYDAVTIMQKNKVPNALVGDIQNPADRWVLHTTPYPARCWLMSGFPCQPLSAQGDRKGALDARSGPFFAMVKLAWEQQMSGLLLECVPNAGQAPYVQDALQKLAYSLGMELVQTTLQLHRAWPCRRTRWWAVIAPKRYQPLQYPDLPILDEMRAIVAFFPEWPRWTANEEGLLALTDYELEMYGNKCYGNDIRHLQNTMPCPCILHSYGSPFQACPCGCRAFPFSVERLYHGGLRGFYVRSTATGCFRYLHVSEAAVLCGFPPRFQFIGTGRDSLCYVGQCASPVQSLWMMANFFHTTNPEVQPIVSLTAYIMYIMKELHGSFQFRALPAQVGFCRAQGDYHQDSMMATPATTIGDWRKAEQKLLDRGQYVQISDEQGPIPDSHYIQTEPLLGTYTMKLCQKKHVAPPPAGPICITLQGQDQQTFYITTPGTFLFEFIDQCGLDRSSPWFNVLTGERMQLDVRLWTPITITTTTAGITAGGISDQGLSDRCLDWMADQILCQRNRRKCWIPSRTSTETILMAEDNMVVPNVFHSIYDGPMWTCIASDGHWLLICLRKDANSLHVHCWNGLSSYAGNNLLPIWSTFGRALGLHPTVLHHHVLVPQQHASTCGTVALLNLGTIFGLWTQDTMPDEAQWHDILCAQTLFRGTFTAKGKGGSGKGFDRDVLWSLRDVLHEHGVPDDRTEERATMAIAKIGLPRLQEALSSKNVWASLKALGSQPRINFLWVKADELEAQIKKKGQSKFKIQTSTKKQPQQNKAKVMPQDLDPSMLKLVPGSFVLEDDTPVTQIDMGQVQAHRAGIAYGTVQDVRPFLRDDKPISMDGLAVLTTTRIPPDQAGLLPVTNLRFPALFGPTTEPLLLDGSLVNLGDRTISRKQDISKATVADIPTNTLKLMLFKDETTIDWNLCKESPLRTLIANFQLLALCKGYGCGGSCGKFHAPVDQEMDAVILDVWSRTWMSLRGKKTAQDDADLFQVFIRVPSVCSLPLQRLSGQDGLYVEPRQTDGRGPDPSTTIIWLPQATFEDAQHKLRTQDRALALSRFGGKYGLRVYARDAEAIHHDLCPDVPFLAMDVHKIWELRPLPHGTQKNGLLAMLRVWGWTAKPLQPCRADSVGMGWTVGSSEDPPSCILPTDRGEITVKTNSFEKTPGFRAQILGAPFALLPSQLLPVAAEMSQ